MPSHDIVYIGSMRLAVKRHIHHSSTACVDVQTRVYVRAFVTVRREAKLNKHNVSWRADRESIDTSHPTAEFRGVPRNRPLSLNECFQRLEFFFCFSGHRLHAIQIEHLQAVSRSTLSVQRSRIQQCIDFASDQRTRGFLHFAFVFFARKFDREGDRISSAKCETDLIVRYYSQLHLEKIRAESKQLEENAHRIANGTLSKEFLEIRWPLGVPSASVPATRHDLLVWTLLNETHQIMPDYEHNSRPLLVDDRDDLRVI